MSKRFKRNSWRGILFFFFLSGSSTFGGTKSVWVEGGVGGRGAGWEEEGGEGDK